MEGSRGVARTPLEHFRGTLKQGTEPTNAHTEPFDKLKTYPGVYPEFAYMWTLPETSKWKKWFRRQSQTLNVISKGWDLFRSCKVKGYRVIRGWGQLQ